MLQSVNIYKDEKDTKKPSPVTGWGACCLAHARLNKISLGSSTGSGAARL